MGKQKKSSKDQTAEEGSGWRRARDRSRDRRLTLGRSRLDRSLHRPPHHRPHHHRQNSPLRAQAHAREWRAEEEEPPRLTPAATVSVPPHEGTWDRPPVLERVFSRGNYPRRVPKLFLRRPDPRDSTSRSPHRPRAKEDLLAPPHPIPISVWTPEGSPQRLVIEESPQRAVESSPQRATETTMDDLGPEPSLGLDILADWDIVVSNHIAQASAEVVGAREDPTADEAGPLLLMTDFPDVAPPP